MPSPFNFNTRYDVPIFLDGRYYTTRSYTLQLNNAQNAYILRDVDGIWYIQIAVEIVDRGGIEHIRSKIAAIILQSMPAGCEMDPNYTLTPVDESSQLFVRLNSAYTCNYTDDNIPVPFDRVARAADQARESYRTVSLDSAGDSRTVRCADLWSNLTNPPSLGIARSTRLRQQSTGKRCSYLTLMPCSDYTKVAKHLLDSDLKLMRVAALRTFKALQRHVNRHSRRAVELWRGYDQSLIKYGIAMAVECRKRGIADTSLEYWRAKIVVDHPVKPAWVYWKALNNSHKSYLQLREERRITVKKLHQHLRDNQIEIGLADFCSNHLLISQKRDWSMHSMQTIHSNIGYHDTVVEPLITNSYFMLYRSENPDETIRYPKDNLCSE